MTEDEAKSHLNEILLSFTLGSILHLLADILRETDENPNNGDAVASEQLKLAESTLVVVGLGIDAARPT